MKLDSEDRTRLRLLIQTEGVQKDAFTKARQESSLCVSRRAGIGRAPAEPSPSSRMMPEVIQTQLPGRSTMHSVPSSNKEAQDVHRNLRLVVLSADQLTKTTPEISSASFERHMDRAGVSSVPGHLVAYIHGEFEPTSELFPAHFHGLATQEKAEASQTEGAMGSIYKRLLVLPSIRIQKIEDREGQLSYRPSGAGRRAVFRDVDGVQNATGAKGPYP